MNKHNSINLILRLVRNSFKFSFTIRDYWEDYHAIGLENNNKLIYIACIENDPDYYFYELELLVDDPEEVYISQGMGDNVSAEELIEIMSKFFDIKPLETSI